MSLITEKQINHWIVRSEGDMHLFALLVEEQVLRVMSNIFDMKIKSCPFCGKPAQIKGFYDFSDCSGDTLHWDVGCNTGDCRGELTPDGTYYTNPVEAIKAWNTRDGN